MTEEISEELKQQVKTYHKAVQAYHLNEHVKKISKQLQDFPTNFSMGFIGVSYSETMWYDDEKSPDNPDNPILKISFKPRPEAELITFLLALMKKRYPTLFDYFIKDKLIYD